MRDIISFLYSIFALRYILEFFDLDIDRLYKGMKQFNINEAFNGVPFCVIDNEGIKYLITDWGKNNGMIWCEVMGINGELLFNMDGTGRFAYEDITVKTYKLIMN
jgi:hypothetical protein